MHNPLFLVHLRIQLVKTNFYKYKRIPPFTPLHQKLFLVAEFKKVNHKTINHRLYIFGYTSYTKNITYKCMVENGRRLSSLKCFEPKILRDVIEAKEYRSSDG